MLVLVLSLTRDAVYCSTSFLPLLDVACGRAMLVGLACSGVKRVCCVLRAALRAVCCSLRCILLELFLLALLALLRPPTLLVSGLVAATVNQCLSCLFTSLFVDHPCSVGQCIPEPDQP